MQVGFTPLTRSLGIEKLSDNSFSLKQFSVSEQAL
jgi:hypothetical protein